MNRLARRRGGNLTGMLALKLLHLFACARPIEIWPPDAGLVRANCFKPQTESREAGEGKHACRLRCLRETNPVAATPSNCPGMGHFYSLWV